MTDLLTYLEMYGKLHLDLIDLMSCDKIGQMSHESQKVFTNIAACNSKARDQLRTYLILMSDLF